MNNTNNSGNEFELKTNEAQEENKPELQKNTDIVLSVGQGITSNQLTQHTLNYSTLLARIKAFEPIETPYIDEIIVSGKISKLPVEDALKYSYTRGKEKALWFIAGCFDGGVRKTESLKYRSAVVLDLDSYKGSITSLEAEIRAELAEYTYIAYSTASHTPVLPKVRIFLPTAENIAVNEYNQISRAFVNGLSFKSAIDAASFKPNQFMFFSGKINITGLPEGVEQPEYHKWLLENEAELLEPSKFKKEEKTENIEILSNASAPLIERQGIESLNISEAELLEKLKEYPASGLSYDEWLEVLMALHNHYNASEQGLLVADEWSKQDAEKYQGIEDIKSKWRSFNNNSSGSQITFLTVLKRIKENKFIIFENNILSNINTLHDKVRDDVLIPIIRNVAEHCSDREAEYYLNIIKGRTDLRISSLRSMLSVERRKLKAIEFKKYANTNTVYALDQKLPPMLFTDEYEAGSLPKCTIENFKKLIAAYGIKIVRNVVSKRDRIILPKDKYLEETGDAARLVRIESLLTANNFAGNKRISPELATEEASNNPYNPISDWIKSKSWDGVDRLQAMYETVEQQEVYKEEDKQLFLRKWFISFIAAMEEKQGVFSKGVLIFQGKQSIGKTSWFKKLLPEPVSEYFLEGATLDPTNKDSIARVTSHALVELGEADSTMKKDIAAIKAFLTSNKDVFRPSYGRVDNKLPRRTIFCASVNDNEYLVDPTGNSRFWTIPVKALNYQHDIDMQQFWAQILTYYKGGELWWLLKAEEEILSGYNEEHVKTCPYTELLLDRYVFPPEENKEVKDKWLGATVIYQQLNMKANEVTGTREVSRILKKLGVRYRRKTKQFLVRDHPDYKSINKFSLFANDDNEVTEVTQGLPKNKIVSNPIKANA